jgi:5-hydroxyisourate hydrolase-like protein (transthyretin family)
MLCRIELREANLTKQWEADMGTYFRGIVGLVAVLAIDQHLLAQDKPDSPAIRTAPLTVTGKAIDESGRPIKGATVYLVSTNSSPAKTLGQTLTDENGNYEFREAPLPESRSREPADQYQVGCFQVFGKAPGRAFAWRGMKTFYVDPKYANAEPSSREFYRKYGFFAGEKIELDLTFDPAKRVSGQFVDEDGKPVPGVKVRLANCDFVDPIGKENHVNYREFWAINQAADVMPEQVLATSDAEGKFELASVPPEVICWLLVKHPKFADASLYTTTAANPPASRDNHPIVTLPIEMTLASVRSIPVRVIRDDTGEPAAGVRVAGRQMRASGNYSGGTSDKDGRVTLKLPPGDYTLEGSPPKELDYIRTSQELFVDQMRAEQPVTLRLKPGCVLILKALDIDTGAGIAGVEFWHVTNEQPGTGKRGRFRMGVNSNTTIVDHPKTNGNGELRAIVIPGTWEYGIGWNRLPAGYDFVDRRDSGIGRQLDLLAGDTVTAEFVLRKIAK